jgi:hypothetical protein
MRIMKTNRWLSSAALGLALLGARGFTSDLAADSTNLLARTTFDSDAPSSWGYGYFYGDGGLGVYEGPDRAYYEASDVQATNAVCRFTFDVSALVGNGNYGVGFGAPQFQPDPDPALFISTNRADYLFSFDSRVEGLLAGSTVANAEMQVQFMNSAVTPNNILQVNLPFTPGNQWSHFTFRLDAGSLGADTSDKTFSQNYTGITALQFNVNLHLPSDTFGFDADNAVLLDNLELLVVSRPPSTNAPAPTFTVPVVDWNFDDKPINNSYQYAWTEHGSQPTMTATYNTPGTGVNGGAAWVLQMDNSPLAGDVPAWAGGGTGGDGPADFTAFKNSDLACYRLSFDARVQGLAPDKATATAALQLFLRAPDDTVAPSDNDTNRDLVVQLNFPITDLDGNWQSFGYLLSAGSVGGGTKTNFTAYFSKIDQLQTQWQIESAAAESTWGFDADNALAVDNFKLERIDVGCPPLVISRDSTDLVATWGAPSTGSARLQSSTKIDGPYADVPGATSPYKTPLAGAQKFYRTVWMPPAQ